MGDAFGPRPTRGSAAPRAAARLGHSVTVAIALGISLIGCEPNEAQIAKNRADHERSQRLYQGEVLLVATAPDGTNLWAAEIGYTRVFFSSRGAEWQEGCGKGCRRTITVPHEE